MSAHDQASGERREARGAGEYNQQSGRIGVRALLSAGARQPQVALDLRLAEQVEQMRLSAEEAALLAGRLLGAAHLARYDAAVYAALAHAQFSPQAHEAVLRVLVDARERVQEHS